MSQRYESWRTPPASFIVTLTVSPPVIAVRMDSRSVRPMETVATTSGLLPDMLIDGLVPVADDERGCAHLGGLDGLLLEAAQAAVDHHDLADHVGLVRVVRATVGRSAARLDRVGRDRDVTGDTGGVQLLTERGAAREAVLRDRRGGVDRQQRNRRRVRRAQPDGALGVDVALALVLAPVDQVERLTPDVGVGLVQRTDCHW